MPRASICLLLLIIARGRHHTYITPGADAAEAWLVVEGVEVVEVVEVVVTLRNRPFSCSPGTLIDCSKNVEQTGSTVLVVPQLKEPVYISSSAMLHGPLYG